METKYCLRFILQAIITLFCCFSKCINLLPSKLVNSGKERHICHLHSRYDDNLRINKKECSTCFYGITATTSIIIVTVFIFITNTDFDPPKRIIILSHENRSQDNQMSTASVIMQQIPTNFQIDSEISITTPLSLQIFHDVDSLEMAEPESLPQKLEFRSYPQIYNEAGFPPNHPKIYNEAGFPPNHNVYPNHRYDARRQLEEIVQPRPFDYFIRGTPPTAFQPNHKNSSNFPQIPKEYVGTVNSIQDILKQVSDSEPNYQDSNGMQKIKIAGTYKHRKVDDITEMFESTPRKNRVKQTDKPTTQTLSSASANSVIRDPFYKYKPNSLSDVNLMATNQFRFAPYHILSNKYVPTSSSHTHSMDPGNLYHQIIMANANRLKYLDENSKNDKIQSKQKPFTLMLDVYPMPDDEHISSTTSQLPVKYQNHFNSHTMRHPGVSSINNLQPYLQNANYPYLKANRYPDVPHYHNPNYFRKYGSKPLNSGLYVSNGENSGNNPSQITVHLNLFPKKKERSNSHNAEIYNKNDKGIPEEGVRFQDRMVKLSDKVQTKERKHVENKESASSEKVSNKVDMDMVQTTSTVSNLKQNVIDESSDSESSTSVDSSEDIFRKEFLQSLSTVSQTEYSSTTPEAKSNDNPKFTEIPTILPIEPRKFNHQLDKLLKTIVH